MKHIILCVLLLHTLRLSAQHQYIAQGYDDMVYYLTGNTVIKTMPISSTSSLAGYMWKNDSIEIVISDRKGVLTSKSFETLHTSKNTVPHFKRAFIPDINDPTLISDSLDDGQRNVEAYTYNYKTNEILAIDEFGHIRLFQDGMVVWEKRNKKTIVLTLGGVLDRGLIKSIRFSHENMIYIQSNSELIRSQRLFRLIELDLASGESKIIAKERDGEITDAFYSDDGKYICYSKNRHNEEKVYQYNREDDKTERKYIVVNNKKIFLKKMFEINE